MYLFGVVIFFLGVLIAGVLKGLPGDVTFSLYQFPVTLPILASILAVLAATRNFRTFGRGLKAAVFTFKPIPEGDTSRAALLRQLLLPRTEVPEDEIGRAAALFRLLSKTTALAAALVSIVSIISVIVNLSNVELIGRGVHHALAAPLFALILIAGVFEPTVFVLKKRQADIRGQRNKD